MQVGMRTKEAFGTPINPHSFRHIASTTIATANPAGVTDVMAVLGHASLKTSEKHYNKATTAAAFRTHQETIAALREET